MEPETSPVPQGGDAISFETCSPIEEHARQVMAWRNDPATLSVSFHRAPKVWQTFWPEYRETYFEDESMTPPLFALAGSERIGFLRFKKVSHPEGLKGTTVDISINLAPESRGRGLGSRVLVSCLAHLRSRNVDYVYAEVHLHNQPSRRAFRSAGFRVLGVKDKLVVDTLETHRIEYFVANTGLS
ncbi:MAG: GNAT family N-acetyltransferase [Alphaproteobacteria bacterium]|nr:GNAT family N-acetyltransferase [Alphaproteobacteria bacterium]